MFDDGIDLADEISSASDKSSAIPVAVGSIGFPTEYVLVLSPLTSSSQSKSVLTSGIAERTVVNSAAFIQNWLEQLQNDRSLIVQAAAQAQKAADFILGTKFDEAPVREA